MQAVAWLCQPLPDLDRPTKEQALAQETPHGLAANDYVVDRVSRDPGHDQIPDVLWSHVLSAATSPAEIWSIGSAAHEEKALDYSLSAMRMLAEQGDVVASRNAAIVLRELGRGEEALAAYDEVVTRYGQDPAPALREQVANAWVNTGANYAKRGASTDATKYWTRVLDRYHATDARTAYAAMSLAALAAVALDTGGARRLLRIARKSGATTAQSCLNVLSDAELSRNEALEELRGLAEGDTDALNFLGIASYLEGDREMAAGFWKQAVDRGDGVAPLLLHLTNVTRSALSRTSSTHVR